MIIFLLFAMFCFACKRLPNIQGKGESLLQGVWEQDSIKGADKMLNYTRHNFKFTCDSFYLSMTTYAKANYYVDSCFNNGIWKEYAKGTYLVSKDTLLLIGDYAQPNFRQKISGCYNTGRYIKNFLIRQTAKEQLLLESLSNQQECLLKLKEAVICEPKEL